MTHPRRRLRGVEGGGRSTENRHDPRSGVGALVLHRRLKRRGGERGGTVGMHGVIGGELIGEVVESRGGGGGGRRRDMVVIGEIRV